MNLFSLLKSNVESWNQWRSEQPDAPCDLAGYDLSHSYLFEGDFRGVNFSGANLQRACLIGADLTGADLTGADLTGAYLGDATIYGANLSHANLTDAHLDRTDLRRAYLLGTQMANADLRTAQLADPACDRYADEVACALRYQTLTTAFRARASQLGVSAHRAAHKAAVSKALRRSLLQQMAQQLQSLTSQSPEVVALRQQAIRQSALPKSGLSQPKVSPIAGAQPRVRVRAIAVGFCSFSGILLGLSALSSSQPVPAQSAAVVTPAKEIYTFQAALSKDSDVSHTLR